MLYLLNSKLLPVRERCNVSVVPLTTDQAGLTIRLMEKRSKMVSAIGHKATAEAICLLTGIEVACQRIEVEMKVGDEALCFSLKKRLGEGQVLTSIEEIEEVGFEWLYYSVAHPLKDGGNVVCLSCKQEWVAPPDPNREDPYETCPSCLHRAATRAEARHAEAIKQAYASGEACHKALVSRVASLNKGGEFGTWSRTEAKEFEEMGYAISSEECLLSYGESEDGYRPAGTRKAFFYTVSRL